MFYSVYFFSSFHLKPILVLLFSQGLVASCGLWLPQTDQRQQTLCTFLCYALPFIWNVLFPFPDPLSLPLWIPTCSSGPSSNSKPVGGKRLPSPLPLPGRAGSFLGFSLSVSSGSCHPSIVGYYVCDALCSLGSSSRPGPCLSHLWITSTLLNIELWFTVVIRS